MSTTVTDPARCRAGGTTRAGLSTPKHTVTSARTASPATCPESVSTPLGTSTATTTAPDPATARTAAAAGSRTAPAPPMPRIPSSTRSAEEITDASTGVVPGDHAGSRCPAPPPPLGRACAPGRRSRTSPPPGAPGAPGPTGHRPRCCRIRPVRPRGPRARPWPPRSRSRQTPASAVEARAMSTGSATPAPASARRTASTEQIGRISTSAPPAYHIATTHAQGQPGLSVPPVTLVTCATVPPGTASEVAESRPLRYFPNQGGSGGPRYHWVSHGSPARGNPRGPGSIRCTTGRELLRVRECAHGIRQLTSQAMRDTR